MKNLPPEMMSWYFKFNWDNKKIWNLNVPTISKHITDLEWHFDIPIWSDTKGKMLQFKTKRCN